MIRTAPSGNEAPGPRGVRDLGELQAPAAEVEHDAVAQRGRVDRGDVAVVGLVGGRQDLDLHRPGALGLGEEDGAVGGVADRAGGDRVDVGGRDPVGAAEAPEHAQRLQAAGHRVVTELAGRLQAGADPDRLVELVGALPPRTLAVGEDDQAPRVRAQVDDRDLMVAGGAGVGGPGGSPAHGVIIGAGRTARGRSPLAGIRVRSGPARSAPRGSR